MTQIVNGIHLPDRDKHFAAQIRLNPIINGKGTYQYAKIVDALESCMTYKFAVDIGANVGLWTRILTRRFEKVAAIEPVPENIECFLMNLDVNYYDHVELHRCAVSKVKGLISLKYEDDAATASVSVYEDRDIEVPCKPLDDFKFVGVDFIKIDVEGFEKNVIESGEFTIRKYKPVIVVEQKKRTVKYDGSKFAGVELLAKWGMNIAWEDHGDFCLRWE